LPALYQGRDINIGLCSPNPNIRVNTTIGTGRFSARAGEQTIEWNYQMDNVPKAMVTQPYQLRIYVYDATNLPKAKLSPGVKKTCWILGGSGALVGLAGLWPYMNALDRHEDYKQFVDPEDPFYEAKGTDRESYYRQADNRYVLAQAMMYTGGAAIAGSAVLALVGKGRAKKELRNTGCAFAPRLRLDPVIVADDGPGLGIRLRF
jgi:hypothetical protein